MAEGVAADWGSGFREKIFDSLDSRGYRVLGCVGEGSFSRVYRVRERGDERVFACKVSGQERLWQRERDFVHRVLGLGTEDGCRGKEGRGGGDGRGLFPGFYRCWREEELFFLVTEYIPGQSLGELMRRRGRLTQRQALRIGIRLAQGLCDLEERGIVYRDLKPDNVIVCEDGELKLIDFGCVCPRWDGELFSPRGEGLAGTYGYAPPEQMRLPDPEAEALPGAYSDVYALGRLLHYLLTGDDPCRPPFEKPPIRRYDRRFSRELEDMIRDCVRRDSRERPPAMRRVLQRMCALEGGRGRRGTAGTGGPRRRKAEYIYDKCVLKTKNSCF